jgi:hypothetical protein
MMPGITEKFSQSPFASITAHGYIRSLLPSHLSHVMVLPPGPPYVFRLLLRALPTSLAAYGVLRVLVGYLGVVLPGWLSFIVFLVAYPARNFVMGYWKAYQNRVAAAAHGAVLIPRVLEGGFNIRASLVKSIKSGYPGMCFVV